MDNPISVSVPVVLLVSQDVTLRGAVQAALQPGRGSFHVVTAADFAAARKTMAELSPDVILLHQSTVDSSAQAVSARTTPLADMVATLAGFAPVIVLGGQEAPSGLSALIAAGAVDFVSSGADQLEKVAVCAEKHVQAARRLSREFFLANGVSSLAHDETFGEILRHELNNPLTGILGNAELLLAETRRQNGASFSAPGLRRLETIAALAVRMRETVRRLSQACEVREEHARPL